MRRRLVMTFEQAFRSGEPSAHRRHQRRVEEQVHRDADRCPGRGDGLAGLYRQRVRALPRLDRHVEMARRVRDLGEQRQLGQAIGPSGVGRHEEVVRLAPNLPARPPLARRRRSSHSAVTSAVTAVSNRVTHMG